MNWMHTILYSGRLRDTHLLNYIPSDCGRKGKNLGEFSTDIWRTCKLGTYGAKDEKKTQKPGGVM